MSRKPESPLATVQIELSRKIRDGTSADRAILRRAADSAESNSSGPKRALSAEKSWTALERAWAGVGASLEAAAPQEGAWTAVPSVAATSRVWRIDGEITMRNIAE